MNQSPLARRDTHQLNSCSAGTHPAVLATKRLPAERVFWRRVLHIRKEFYCVNPLFTFLSWLAMGHLAKIRITSLTQQTSVAAFLFYSFHTFLLHTLWATVLNTIHNETKAQSFCSLVILSIGSVCISFQGLVCLSSLSP